MLHYIKLCCCFAINKLLKFHMKRFDELFYSLPNHPTNDQQRNCRQQILARCQVSNNTLVNWLTGRFKMSGSVQLIVADVMRKWYPDVEIDFSIPKPIKHKKEVTV